MKTTLLSWGLLLALVVGVAPQGLAQTNEPTRKAQKEYQKALEAYRFMSPNLALSHLDDAINRSPLFAEALFLKAQIYQDMSHPQQEEALAQALNANATMFPHGWITLAEIQWNLGKYQEGLQSLARLDELSAPRMSEESERRRAWVEAGLTFAVEAMAKEEEVLEAEAVQGGLNTEALEYYGALDLSGTRMVLTRSDLSSEEQRTTPGVVGGEDFFESVQLDDGTWSPPVPLRGVNTPMNEGAPTLSGDGKTMVFTACATPRDGYGPRRGKGSCDLFESTWDESTQQWSLGSNLGAPNSALQGRYSADETDLALVDSSVRANLTNGTGTPCARWASS